jgi:DNA polymerase-4
MPRVILHIDMDAFFASVEVLDRPELRGKPVIVGGPAVRGVVSAASYEARAFGVHSAMPMTEALRRCPQAVVMPVRGGRYADMSRRIMALLEPRTPLLEQVSVDEAYLDLTNWLPVGATGASVAAEIQAEVFRETGLTCSLGVATGKAIAKMASDLRKPNGLVVVPPGDEAAFLAPLAIGKLRGVGAATEKRLRALGVQTIGDLARLPATLLGGHFGVVGADLLALAQGRDDSPVVPERQAKSIGRETTFWTDISERAVLERTLLMLADDVAESLRRHGFLARGVTLKLRDDDFRTITRSHTLPEPTDVTEALYAAGRSLLTAARWHRPTRLIGITAGPLQAAADRQFNLFSETGAKQRKVADAVDAIKARFGDAAITRARLAKQDQERS